MNCLAWPLLGSVFLEHVCFLAVSLLSPRSWTLIPTFHRLLVLVVGMSAAGSPSYIHWMLFQPNRPLNYKHNYVSAISLLCLSFAIRKNKNYILAAKYYTYSIHLNICEKQLYNTHLY